MLQNIFLIWDTLIFPNIDIKDRAFFAGVGGMVFVLPLATDIAEELERS